MKRLILTSPFLILSMSALAQDTSKIMKIPVPGNNTLFKDEKVDQSVNTTNWLFIAALTGTLAFGVIKGGLSFSSNKYKDGIGPVVGFLFVIAGMAIVTTILS